ncbi:MAG: hypothetical protein JSU63_13200 [Phycisphaerales bacterium]|nr:MAG: hypothetical protein JSU63_13200 [Phycisphaerales bacterium]
MNKPSSITQGTNDMFPVLKNKFTPGGKEDVTFYFESDLLGVSDNHREVFEVSIKTEIERRL